MTSRTKAMIGGTGRVWRVYVAGLGLHFLATATVAAAFVATGVSGKILTGTWGLSTEQRILFEVLLGWFFLEVASE